MTKWRMVTLLDEYFLFLFVAYLTFLWISFFFVCWSKYWIIYLHEYNLCINVGILFFFERNIFTMLWGRGGS